MTQPNPVEIVFRNLPQYPHVEDEVRAQFEHLGRFHDRIHGCRAVIEPDQRHHQTGNRYRVTLHLHLPGQELVVGRHPARAGHDDVLLAVRDAFKALGRQLQDHTQRRRGDVKEHTDPAARGQVIQLEWDHGFIETLTGRELYFHRNSVVNMEFEDLTVGAEVRFHEEQGEHGPQASSVSYVGRGTPLPSRRG